MLSRFRWRVIGGMPAPLSIGLALAGTLAFALLMFQFSFICSACLNPPNAHYVSWAMFGIVLLSPVAYLVALFEKRSKNNSSSSVPSRKLRTILFVVVMALVLSLSALRFVLEPTPQGSDTPNYLYASNIILEKGSPLTVMGDGREFTFILLALLRLLVEGLFGQSFQLSMMIFPVLLSNVLALATFRLVSSLTRDYELAIASTALSGFSFFLVRMSYDLFAQMLGISIMLLLFSSLTGPLSNRASRKSLIQIAFLSATLTLAHAYTWILGIVILTLYVFTSYLEGIGPRLKPVLAVLVPGVAYFGTVSLFSGIVLGLLPEQWYERTLATPSVVQGVLFPFQTGSFSPLSFSFFSEITVGFENPLILTAAAFGALSLLRPNSEQHLPRLLFSWMASLVVLLLLGFSQQYRLIILMPIGILAGYAATRVARSDNERMRLLWKFPLIPKFPGKAVGGAFLLILLIFLAFPFSVPRAFAPQHVYYPNGDGVQQLLRIRELFGFGNSTVLILVEDPGFFQNNFQWARAVTGANVYQGSVTELADGKPFLFGGVIPIRPDFQSLSVIVIPPALYTMGDLEMSIFRREGVLYLATPAMLLSLVSSEAA